MVEPIFVYSVFTSENLLIAVNTLLAVSWVIEFLFVWVTRHHKNKISISTKLHGLLTSHKVTRIETVLFCGALGFSVFLGIFFCVTNTTILDIPYPNQGETQWTPYYFPKLTVILSSIALLSGYRMRLQKGRCVKSWLLCAKIGFVMTTVCLLLVDGSRGFVTFLSLFFAGLDFYFYKLRQTKLWGSVFFIVFSFWIYACWPYMRVALARIPFDVAFWYALEGLFIENTGVEQKDILLSHFPMLGMSVFHFLYVIQLIQDGISLEGSTFVNLIAQAIPLFISDFFSIARPLNDNYLLADYYRHLGGFFTLGNAYWNGGFWVALGFIVIVTLFFIWFDNFLFSKRSSNLYRIIYVIYFPPMVVQLCYGVQGLVRVLEIFTLLILINKYIRPTMSSFKPSYLKVMR